MRYPVYRRRVLISWPLVPTKRAQESWLSRPDAVPTAEKLWVSSWAVYKRPLSQLKLNSFVTGILWPSSLSWPWATSGSRSSIFRLNIEYVDAVVSAARPLRTSTGELVRWRREQKSWNGDPAPTLSIKLVTATVATDTEANGQKPWSQPSATSGHLTEKVVGQELGELRPSHELLMR